MRTEVDAAVYRALLADQMELFALRAEVAELRAWQDEACELIVDYGDPWDAINWERAEDLLRRAGRTT